MTWLLLGIVAVAIIWGIGAARAPGRRAPNVLNNQGLPRGYTRKGHRQNDEE